MADPTSAVTLPMHQILAQAPEMSPWHGMEDEPGFDVNLARTLDELSAVDRILAIKRLRGVGRREKDLLESIASQGWVTWISHKWLQWVTDRSESSVSHGLGTLRRDGLIRVSSPRIAADGSRLYLATISGEAIIRGYAAHRGGQLDVTSSAPKPDGSIPGGQLDVTSSEARPDGTTPGGQLDVTSSEAKPDGSTPGGQLDVTSSEARPDGSTPGGQLDVTSSEAKPEDSTGGAQLDVTSSAPKPDGSITGGAAGHEPALKPHFPATGEGALDVTSSDQGPSRARALAPAPSRAVRSFVDDIEIHDIDDISIINEQTNSARARANEPPDWWPLFLQHFGELEEPRPKRPAWQEVLAFRDPDDIGLTVLQEACGRFLDTYCHPGAPPVGRVRGAVRAIYQVLVDQALRLPGGIDEFALQCWAAEHYLTPVSAEEAEEWTEGTIVPKPRNPEPPSGDWPLWYCRLREHFPDFPGYEYCRDKASEYGNMPSPVLVRAAELTVQGCRHPDGALKYWLRALATAKTQSESAQRPWRERR